MSLISILTDLYSCRVRPCRRKTRCLAGSCSAGSDPAAKQVSSSFRSEQSWQAGQSTVYIILIIVVIIFAVMLAGGGNSLFTGNEPSSVTDEPTPSVDPLSTTTPGSLTPAAGGWNIAVTLDGCRQGKTPTMTGNVKVDGPSNGTVELWLGSKAVGTPQPFTSPTTNYPLTLPNDSGFGTENWEIRVVSAGTVVTKYNGVPTGCK